jgi:hypothetical protein
MSLCYEFVLQFDDDTSQLVSVLKVNLSLRRYVGQGHGVTGHLFWVGPTAHLDM